MNTQPDMFPHFRSPSPDRDAEIIPFQPRSGETVDANELNVETCVSFFLEKWDDLSLNSSSMAELITADAGGSDGADDKQEYLQKAVDNSPVFDHYDDLIEVDTVVRLLHDRLKASLPKSRDEGISLERKAALTLLYLRGAQIIKDPDQSIDVQVARLPFGDEGIWESLVDRLIPQK